MKRKYMLFVISIFFASALLGQGLFESENFTYNIPYIDYPIDFKDFDISELQRINAKKITCTGIEIDLSKNTEFDTTEFYEFELGEFGKIKGSIYLSFANRIKISSSYFHEGKNITCESNVFKILPDDSLLLKYRDFFMYTNGKLVSYRTESLGKTRNVEQVDDETFYYQGKNISKKVFLITKEVKGSMIKDSIEYSYKYDKYNRLIEVVTSPSKSFNKHFGELYFQNGIDRYVKTIKYKKSSKTITDSSYYWHQPNKPSVSSRIEVKKIHKENGKADIIGFTDGFSDMYEADFSNQLWHTEFRDGETRHTIYYSNTKLPNSITIVSYNQIGIYRFDYKF